MFSGIVESKTRVRGFEQRGDIHDLIVERPQGFDDISIGDSIANDGVCLTVEELDAETLRFAVGKETATITSWAQRLSVGSEINLERSLRFGDRVHGHLVTGHVDTVASVKKAVVSSEVMDLEISVPASLQCFFWKKGSAAVNGVSLTINDVRGDVVSFHLIPETLRRTNLSSLVAGDVVNLEVDSSARAAVRAVVLRDEGENG